MVIAGIRHKIKTDIDTRRTVSFTKYLIHYLRTFAILGVIVPILIGTDYLLDSKIKVETVGNKFFQVMNDQNNVEYHIYTDSHHFIANTAFYEHTNIGDQVAYYYTPIFGTLTDISHQEGTVVYICKPFNIYNWPLFIAALTMICSVVLLIKTRRKKTVKYDAIINLGVVNAFLCLFVLVAVLFHMSF